MFGSEACVCGLSARGWAAGGGEGGGGAGGRESSQAGPGTNGS